MDVVPRGYVDDPRNTDNAWMETVAFSFHDPSGQQVKGLIGVQWFTGCVGAATKFCVSELTSV